MQISKNQLVKIKGRFEEFLSFKTVSIGGLIYSSEISKNSITLLNNGKIRLIDNQTGDPIKNVNVYTSENGTTTNEQGFCSLDLFDKMDEITFSMIGYETITKRYVEISKIDTLNPSLARNIPIIKPVTPPPTIPTVLFKTIPTIFIKF